MATEQTWVALLRAVNVGGTGKLPMATLREVVAGLGHTDVRTYIQSGNVVFTGVIDDREAASAALSDAIERAVGHRPPAVLRTRGELVAFAEGNPFLARGVAPDSLHGIFFPSPVPAEAAARATDGFPPGEAVFAGADAWLHFPDGTASSKLAAFVTSRRGGGGTIRNWRTVGALLTI